MDFKINSYCKLFIGMELGRAKLRKVGINNLHSALHPSHGAVWTDGKGIYLAPVHLDGAQIQNAASVKLGEFENVASVHWSNISTADSCHLCVVHQHNVTVWRVSGALPKLSFKQVRKINVRPLPQGCLWNPCSDVLCLLSRHQCSFYFRHDSNKGSYAFPALENGSISCGCWSSDGRKLILCVGTALLIYRWPDVNCAIENYAASAWRIPGLEGRLVSITPVLKDSLVVAAEIPLESLCRQQQDILKFPTDSQGDSGTEASNDGVIRPNKTPSITESLMNLQQNTQVVAESRSSLTLVRLSEGSNDPIKVLTLPLKGVISPDILLFEKRCHCVIVGSNSLSQLHIYALLEKHLSYCGNIQLDKGQRPKGLCSMPLRSEDRGSALLILVGQREMEDHGLAAPTLEAEFRLFLKYIILKAGYNHLSKQPNTDGSQEKTFHQKSSSLINPQITKSSLTKKLSDPGLKLTSEPDRLEPEVSMARSYHDSHLANQATAVKTRYVQLDSGTNEEHTQLLFSPEELGHQIESETTLRIPTRLEVDDKNKKIEDLSSQLSNPANLEVEPVSFSSQAPSFSNPKLAARYELGHVKGQSSADQADSSLHFSLKDSEKRELDQTVLNGYNEISAPSLPDLSSNMTGECCATNQMSGTDVTRPEKISVEVKKNREISNIMGYDAISDNLNASIYSETKTVDQTGAQNMGQCQNNSNITSFDLRSNPEKSVSSSRAEVNCSAQISKPQMAESNSPLDPNLPRDALAAEKQTPDMRDSSPSSIDILTSRRQDISPAEVYNYKSSKSQQTQPEQICLRDFKPPSTQVLTREDSSEGVLSRQSPKLSAAVSVSSQDLGEVAITESGRPTATISSSQTTQSSSLLQHIGLANSCFLEGATNLNPTQEDILSDAGLGSSLHSLDSDWDELEKQAKLQRDSISALQRHLEKLSLEVEQTPCVTSAEYQNMNHPETIDIDCGKPKGTETKRFLLDNGRLQLEPVKMAFDLATVEIWIDGVPCVVGANIDGYIPLKFTPFARLRVTGKTTEK